MSKISFDFLNDGLFSRGSRRWSRATQEVSQTPLSVLRQQRNQAGMLKTQLDQFTSKADSRLAAAGAEPAFAHRPANADWVWRPDVWAESLAVPGHAAAKSRATLGEAVTLFHDCPMGEITLRQAPNQRTEDIAPFGLILEVLAFEGSFLSFVLDLPDDGIAQLGRNHILTLDTQIEFERPLEVFARLNIKHGPNTEQMIREVPLDDSTQRVEFDLGYARLNNKQAERAWIDLIFEAPQMNQVVLRDLTMIRRPRAQV